MPAVVYTTANRDEVRALIRSLPAILAGTAPDPHKIAEGFKLRLGMAALSTIKEAYIVKARGEADATGLRWPPLSREYLAYQRPDKKSGRGRPKAGKFAPGGKDGMLSKKQLADWRRIYGKFLAINAAMMPTAQAKVIAARVAWSKLKAEGAQTKIDSPDFGGRVAGVDYEILRDRGILFNSLSPGTLSQQGLGATYSKPPGGEDQVFIADRPGELIIGTNVSYAVFHHGHHGEGKRPLWPDPESWPADWWEDWLEVAVQGIADHFGDALK